MGTKDENEKIENVKKEVEMIKVEMLFSPNFYNWMKTLREDYYKRGGKELSLSDFLMNWCYDMVTIQKDMGNELMALKEGKNIEHMYG